MTFSGKKAVSAFVLREAGVEGVVFFIEFCSLKSVKER